MYLNTPVVIVDAWRVDGMDCLKIGFEVLINGYLKTEDTLETVRRKRLCMNENRDDQYERKPGNWRRKIREERNITYINWDH